MVIGLTQAGLLSEILKIKFIPSWHLRSVYEFIISNCFFGGRIDSTSKLNASLSPTGIIMRKINSFNIQEKKVISIQVQKLQFLLYSKKDSENFQRPSLLGLL